MRTLDKRCILCDEKPVIYVKLKGGFLIVCAECKELLYSANLVMKDDIITPK